MWRDKSPQVCHQRQKFSVVHKINYNHGVGGNSFEACCGSTADKGIHGSPPDASCIQVRCLLTHPSYLYRHLFTEIWSKIGGDPRLKAIFQQRIAHRALYALASVSHSRSVRTVDQKFAAVKKSVKPQRRNASALQAVSSMEVAQIASEGGFIGGVAGVMVGLTLIVSLQH